MAYNTFGPGLALDKITMRGLPARAAILTDSLTGDSVQAYTLGENPQPIVLSTNGHGYFPEFQTLDDVEILRIRFGQVELTQIAWEVVRQAASAEARVIDLVGQYGADVAAQNLKLTNVSDRLESVEVLGGLAPGDVSDATVKSHIINPASDTAAALNIKISAATGPIAAALPGKLDRAKDDNGGQFPTPLRVPVVSVQEVWPNLKNPYTPLWVDDATIYAYGRDNMLRKSIDRGKTWTKRGYNAYGFGGYQSFLKLSTGTLLNIHSIAGAHIQRSTDDGATWTIIHDWRTNRIPLGSQSWAVDRVTGYIYYGEYTNGDQLDVNIYRSTNDGLTFEVFHTFKGALTGGTGYIRHIHSVQWDHVAQRIVISCGDSTDFTGLWRINAAGTGVEKILTNDMMTAGQIDSSRSIGIMPFPDYIAWAGDTTLQPYIFRMARSEIGKANPVFEKVYRLNSTAWFTCKASTDGSRWVLSASNEGAALDNLVHLYSVEDQGATVWEVGSIAAPSVSSTASLQPIGQPEQGESFNLLSRGFGENLAWSMRLGRGMTPLVKPDPLPDVLVQQTASAGYLSLATNEERIIQVTQAGGLARRLHIFDAGTGEIDRGTATLGPLSVSVRKRGAASSWSTVNLSERYTTRQDAGQSLANVLFTGGDIVEMVIKNNSTVSAVTCAPSITFGWGVA